MQHYLGLPYKVTLALYEPDGSLFTGSLTSGGAVNLYGPASTTQVATSTLTQDGELWSATFGATYFAAPGLYRWVVPTVNYGGTIVENQGGSFVVSAAVPWRRMLREVVKSVWVQLGDCFPGKTTGPGTAATLVCSRLKYGSTNEWAGAELVILEPGAATDATPNTVTGSDPATGTLTFEPAVTATVAGQDFLLGNRQGAGWPYSVIVDAIRSHFDELMPTVGASDEVGLATVAGTYEYALPAGIIAVEGLEYRSTGEGVTGVWHPVRRGRGGWDVLGGRRVLVFDREWGAAHALRLRVRVAAAFPEHLAAVLPCDTAWLTNAALLDCLEWKGEPRFARRIEGLRFRVERGRPRRLPGPFEAWVA